MEQTNGKQIVPRRSKSQMLELLGEYDKHPGMTVKAFCKVHQVNESSFYTARKRYVYAGKPVPKQAGFIAIPSPGLSGSAGTLFAEVNGIRLYQAVSADYLKALLS